MPEYAWMYLNKQDSQYTLGENFDYSEYWILSKYWVLNMSKFWI